MRWLRALVLKALRALGCDPEAPPAGGAAAAPEPGCCRRTQSAAPTPLEVVDVVLHETTAPPPSARGGAAEDAMTPCGRVAGAIACAFHELCAFGAFDLSNTGQTFHWPDYWAPAFDAHNVLSSALLLLRRVFAKGYRDTFASRLMACACLTVAMKAARQTALKFAYRLSANPYEVDTLGTVYARIFCGWPTLHATEFRLTVLHNRVVDAEATLLCSQQNIYKQLFDSPQTHSELLIWTQNANPCDDGGTPGTNGRQWPSREMLMARNVSAFLLVALQMSPCQAWARQLPCDQLGDGLAHAASAVVAANGLTLRRPQVGRRDTVEVARALLQMAADAARAREPFYVTACGAGHAAETLLSPAGIRRAITALA